MGNDKQWSAEQQAIFSWFRQGRGNLVVRARAGTGKTTTIEAGITQAPEGRIGYSVFNKKNQLEAREKIQDSRVKVNTGHSLGFAFVKFIGGWKAASPEKSAQVERARVEGAAPTNLRGRLPRPAVTSALDLVAWAKATAPFSYDKPDQLAEMARRKGFVPGDTLPDWGPEQIAALASGAMKAALKKDPQNRISFDDMVWLPVVKNWTRPWYDLLVIDEAQDTNVTGLLLARGAVKKTGRVCVVGDDRQAIYGFRGADSRALDRLADELDAQELGLTTTYRCPKAVVAQAARLVPDYKAAPSAPEGLVTSTSLQGLLDTARPGDAILSRKNAPLMGLCLQFLKTRVPARIEGRDIGLTLRRMVEGFRASTIAELLERVAEWRENRVNSLVAAGCEEEALFEAVHDQADVIVALAEESRDAAEVAARLTELFQDSNGRVDAVVLSSVHKAKGLEWTRCFLLRSTFSARWSDAVSEELNIKYVAITRAKPSWSGLKMGSHGMLVESTRIGPLMRATTSRATGE